MIKLSAEKYHLINAEGISQTVEVVEMDVKSKCLKVAINGRVYEVLIKDKMDLLLEQMGMSAANSGKVKDIRAPMPGLVLEIMAKTGDKVEKGTPILILEAMKMENILKAPGNGVIANIKANKDTAVDKGDVLVVFE